MERNRTTSSRVRRSRRDRKVDTLGNVHNYTGIPTTITARMRQIRRSNIFVSSADRNIATEPLFSFKLHLRSCVFASGNAEQGFVDPTNCHTLASFNNIRRVAINHAIVPAYAFWSRFRYLPIASPNTQPNAETRVTVEQTVKNNELLYVGIAELEHILDGSSNDVRNFYQILHPNTFQSNSIHYTPCVIPSSFRQPVSDLANLSFTFATEMSRRRSWEGNMNSVIRDVFIPMCIDEEVGVTNSQLPFLRRLMSQVDKTYRQRRAMQYDVYFLRSVMVYPFEGILRVLFKHAIPEDYLQPGHLISFRNCRLDTHSASFRGLSEKTQTTFRMLERYLLLQSNSHVVQEVHRTRFVSDDVFDADEDSSLWQNENDSEVSAEVVALQQALQSLLLQSEQEGQNVYYVDISLGKDIQNVCNTASTLMRAMEGRNEDTDDTSVTAHAFYYSLPILVPLPAAAGEATEDPTKSAMSHPFLFNESLQFQFNLEVDHEVNNLTVDH